MGSRKPIERDDQLHAAQAEINQLAQESRPAGLVLLGAFADAQYLAVALGIDVSAEPPPSLFRLNYEYMCKVWTSEPNRFIVNPIHQMPGLNT